jgi:hypothetical protein
MMIGNSTSLLPPKLDKLFQNLRGLKYNSKHKNPDEILNLKNIDKQALKYIDKHKHKKRIQSLMRFPNWHSYIINKHEKQKYQKLDLNDNYYYLREQEQIHKRIDDIIDSFLIEGIEGKEKGEKENDLSVSSETKQKVQAKRSTQVNKKKKKKSKNIIIDNVTYHQSEDEPVKVRALLLTSHQKRMLKNNPSLTPIDVGGKWRFIKLNNFAICKECNTKLSIDKQFCTVCQNPMTTIIPLN